MTLDPYPPELLDELPPEVPSTAPDPLVNAITRLAQAIEGLVRGVDNGNALVQSAVILPTPKPPSLAPLPPVQTNSANAAPQVVDVQMFDGCPIHHAPWKVVPAGVSKKTGRAYDAFKACPVAGCDQRPKL